MPKLGNYWLSRSCVWGLAGSVALWALTGVIATFTPDGEFWGLDRVGWCVRAFALVTVFSILCVNVMAAAIMHAIARPGGWNAWHWPTLFPATICMFIFASASNMGMHLGWDVLRGAPGTALPSESDVQLIFLALACAKPGAMLAIGGREAMDQARLDEEKRAEQDRTDRSADIERDHRHTQKLARIATKGSVERSVESRAATTVKDQRKPPAPAKGEKAPYTLEARKLALSLLAQGHKPLDVHKRTGVPHGTTKRWAWELKKQSGVPI